MPQRAGGGVAEQAQLRRMIGLPAGLEDFGPAIVDIAEDARDKLPMSSVGAPVVTGGAGALCCVAGAAAGENFRAADQDARIDAEGVPADKAEHDDGADAEPAAAHRKTEAAAHAAAGIVATVLDIVAATEIIVTHRAYSPSLPLPRAALQRT